MRNPNRSGSASGSVIAGFLSLFFIGIILFVLIGYVDILDYDAGTPALVFEIISLVAVGIVCGLAPAIKRAVGTACYASIAGITVIYAIAQLIFTLVSIDDIKTKTYILISLIVLFIYCVIVLPIGLNGAKNKND